MATGTITNTLLDPDGDPIPGITVIARLSRLPSSRLDDDSTVTPPEATVSNASGVWTLELEASSNLSNGSQWVIEERIPSPQGGSVHTLVNVIAGTTQDLADARITSVTGAPAGSFYSTEQIDALLGNLDTAGITALNLRLDAAEADIDTNTSAITAEATTRGNADTALDTRVTALEGEDFLEAANNLSDVGDAATARTNLNAASLGANTYSGTQTTDVDLALFPSLTTIAEYRWNGRPVLRVTGAHSPVGGGAEVPFIQFSWVEYDFTGNPTGAIAQMNYSPDDNGAFKMRFSRVASGTSALLGAMGAYDPDGDIDEDLVNRAAFNVVKNRTGWASYADGTYTSGSPLTLTAGVITSLPNDATTTLETQLPDDCPEGLYDSSTGKIIGRNGDGYIITIDCKASCSSPSGASLEAWIDIGGSVGDLYQTTLTSFPKGTAVHGCTRTISVYTLDTWEANGGTVEVRANVADVDVWDIRYVIHRIHKAR